MPEHQDCTAESISSADLASMFDACPAGALVYAPLRGDGEQAGWWSCRYLNDAARLAIGCTSAKAAASHPHAAALERLCALVAESPDRDAIETLTDSSDAGTSSVYEACGASLGRDVLIWIRPASGTPDVTSSPHAFTLAVAHSRIGTWDWNLETNRTWRSRSYLELLGYSVGEVLPSVNETWEVRLHPDDHAIVQHALHAHLFERKRYEVEYRLRTKQGAFKWVREFGVAVRDHHGTPLHVVGAIVDIDSLKRTERDLERARLAAEAASAAKSSFLANMSHEIRTPMTAIVGYAELLDDPTVTSAQRSEYLETIRRNGEHLLELINDILDLSKIEANRLGVENVECAFDELVVDLFRLMRARIAPDADVAVDVCFASAMPRRVMSDPVRLRQILVNLVGNAVKFTSTGHVRLVLSYDRRPDASPCLNIRVEDTGIGMTPQQIGRLFSPFSQADSSTTRRYGGTGLGLTISQRLAGLLGGSIRVTSTLGIGSTFDLVVPVTIPDDSQFFGSLDDATIDAGDTTETTPPANAKVELVGHVLLVEDGKDNQRLVRRLLEHAGLSVEVADNGLEAVERMQRTDAPTVDLILMDMQMPILDGYSATERLRDAGHTLPVVALTAHAMSGDRERCLEAGCTEYLSKPIKRTKLIQLLEALLPGE